MSDNNDGIQKLLVAEDEAAAVVDKARKNRVQRLKQARVEAEKANESFREELQAKFEAELGEADGSEDFFKQLDAKTEEEKKTMRESYAKNKDAVQQMLMYFVGNVKLEVSDATKQAALTKGRAEGLI